MDIYELRISALPLMGDGGKAVDVCIDSSVYVMLNPRY